MCGSSNVWLFKMVCRYFDPLIIASPSKHNWNSLCLIYTLTAGVLASKCNQYTAHTAEVTSN